MYRLALKPALATQGLSSEIRRDLRQELQPDHVNQPHCDTTDAITMVMVKLQNALPLRSAWAHHVLF
jgi:hypothetical protein